MQRFRRVWLRRFLIFLPPLCGEWARAQPDQRPPIPPINTAQKSFLSSVARRTIRDAALGRPTYEPEYVPEALRELSVELVVRVRHHGFLLSTAAGGPKPIVLAVRDAALKASEMLRRDASVPSDPASLGGLGGSVDDEARRTRREAGDDAAGEAAVLADPAAVTEFLIEIEVAGPPEPLDFKGPWTQPRAVDAFVEPGIHGLVLVGPGARRSFCPTEMITTDLVLADALKQMAKSARLGESQLSDVRLHRFRTVHWYEPRSGEAIVSLHRGLTLVSPGDVSREGIDAVVSRLAEYMAYRQLPSGLFTYQYEPGRDMYSDENNLVRQVGSVVAMAMHARVSGKETSRAAADLAIRYHLQGLSDVPGVENAAFIATADQRHKLGVTALFCLALSEHPDSGRFTDTRGRLVNGMMSLQRPSGMFVTAFPPAFEVESQEYFPGEALLALAVDYQREPSGRILDAFDRAVAFYRDFFAKSPSPAFVSWQVQSFARMAEQANRKDFSDYVFHLSDWLADRQLSRENCEWPELWGGVAAYSDGRAGVATAAYLEAFADALALARLLGDEARAKRYEEVVRAAARFVMQLQVRPEEAYFICSPRDAVGGIRTSPSLNLLRIDHCQHALVALLKTRDVLFPD